MGCGGSRNDVSSTPVEVVGGDADLGSGAGGSWAQKKEIAAQAVEEGVQPTSAADETPTLPPRGAAGYAEDGAILEVGEETDKPAWVPRKAPEKKPAYTSALGPSVDGRQAFPETFGIMPTYEPPSAANAQEAPLTDAEPVDEPRRGLLSQPEGGHLNNGSMTRQQQEEAARLAETRRRFEQRYQQGGTGQMDLASPKTVAAQSIGMSLNEPCSPKGGNSQQYGAYLPGGIMEEVEITFQQQIQGKIEAERVKRQDREAPYVATWNGPKSGFDDADEELMKEILEDFDP